MCIEKTATPIEMAVVALLKVVVCYFALAGKVKVFVVALLE